MPPPAHHRYAPRECGELALCQALLAQSIREALGKGIITASGVPRWFIQQEAQRWIASTDMDWPFSFEPLCLALGLTPSAIRRRVWQRLRLKAAA